MERVAFLIEPEDQRISCLLNPETVVIKRNAGIKPRDSIGGVLSGAGMSDTPLLFTGGGHTWIDLELLFDINLPGSTMITDDVRHLSGLFFKMAENSSEENDFSKPPIVRMVWGKSWNIPGVVTHVAERLDCFNGSGVPSRSWLKLRFRRVIEDHSETASLLDWLTELEASIRIIELLEEYSSLAHATGSDQLDQQSETALVSERLDLLAQEFFDNPALWRFIAVFNGIGDPFTGTGGRTVRIPPISELVKML